jgi:hypothetical protein
MIPTPFSRGRRGFAFVYVFGILLAIRQEVADGKTFLRLADLSGSSESDPIPVSFPNSFQIDFVTNITRQKNQSLDFLLEREIDNSKPTNSTWIPGRLYYDWTRKMQRIDHGPGSYECVHFYHYDGPCSLVFIPDWGMYRILLPKEPTSFKEILHGDKIEILNDSQETSSPSFDCCLDIPNIGTPPPRWAEQGNPTYNGIAGDSFSNLSAHEWVFDHVSQDKTGFAATLLSLAMHPSRQITRPAEQYHTTRQVVDGEFAGRPLLFTFPSAGGMQDYHYFVDTMKKVNTIDASIFALPDGCQTQFCKCKDSDSSGSQMMREDGS